MTVLIVIIGISVLILIHEFGHFLVAKKMGLLVEEFGFGFPPRLFSKKIEETTYSLNLLPFGGFVKIYGEDHDTDTRIDTTLQKKTFHNQPVWKRSFIIVAGVVMNFLLGWLLMSVIFMVGTPRALLISQVLPDSPAAAVGLMPQDRIKGFDNAKDFVAFINQHRGKETTITVQRNGQEITVKSVPRLQGAAALGVGLIEAGVARHGFFASFWEGLKASAIVIITILLAFVNLLWGLLTQGKVLVDFVGPVGIFGVASQAGALGFVFLLQLISIISLNLTVLNILPFPALDGGRLLFIFIEKIKGSPLSPDFERAANAAGFIILLLLMIAITVRDVAKLF